jgi:hypothetical protein
MSQLLAAIEWYSWSMGRFFLLCFRLASIILTCGNNAVQNQAFYFHQVVGCSEHLKVFPAYSSVVFKISD